MLRLLKEQADTQPDKIALYASSTQYSWSDVAKHVTEWMHYFDEMLSHETRRVGVFSHNSVDMYMSLIALWSLGRDIVCLNTRLSDQELRYQLSDADVSVVISDQSRVLALGTDVRVIEMSLKETTHRKEMPIVEMASLTSVMYTSGTTGQPKGVVQSFSNHLASALATQKNLSIDQTDVWGCAVPLFHISGLSILMRHLILGVGIVLYDGFNTCDITEDLVTGKVTVFSVVTKMLEDLLSVYPTTGYSSSFKTFLLGGGPVPISLLHQCEVFELSVIQSYGMTETCSQVVALSSRDALWKCGSAGKPLEGVSLRILDRKTGKEAHSHHIGDIVIRGDQVITHYLNDAHWHDTVWDSEGWFRTGDLGYLDEDGYLYVVSRLSELIISGGENIYPAEVEHTIKEMTDIEDIAVVGEENKEWGAVPIAFYVSDCEVNQLAITELLGSELATYKQPKKWIRCWSLPRTASGKLAKHRLLTKEREAYVW